MKIPRDTRWMPAVATRASSDSSSNSSRRNTKIMVAIGVIVFVLAFAVFAFYIRRKQVRRTNSHQPSWLRRVFPRVFGRGKKAQYSSQLQNREADAPETQNVDDREMEGAAATEEAGTASSSAGVDRNTSVRSVMTLPAYSPMARPTERILGREGERAGIDVVIEFPETVDEEENRREEEMESLYQIRAARRREQADREERRRLRREARARGDTEALADIRRRAETAASESLSTVLIAEHQNMTQNRERRVSSVNYADLGVARHDGTRIRANSSESDHRPLLDSAAPISGSRPISRASLFSHQRGRSASSVLSISTTDDDAWPGPGAHRTVTNTTTHSRTPSDFEVVAPSHSRSPSSSRLNLVTLPGSDVADLGIPPPDPPQYDYIDLELEEAPPYESPMNARTPVLPSPTTTPTPTNPDGTPTLPQIERLPSIRIQQMSPIGPRNSNHAPNGAAR